MLSRPSAAVIATAVLALGALPAPALAAANIMHRDALRVDRQFEAHGLGGHAVGCKTLKSGKVALCRVNWNQYTWLDVVTRDGGCTHRSGRVIAGRSNCYTGPVVALHVAYSIKLRPKYAGREVSVLR